MELREVIEKRESIRDYEDKPIPQEKLLRVLEAARLAPSGSNRQPWKFVVVKDRQTRQKLAQAAEGQTFVGKAPVVIAAVATMPELVMICGVAEYPVDLAIAVDQVEEVYAIIHYHKAVLCFVRVNHQVNWYC